MSDYAEFLNKKLRHADNSGFEPIWMPDFLFDFQQYSVDWALRKGRAALYYDCGMGKTPMQLVWSQNVVQKTNKPVLIVAPLAVSHQFVNEANKFGIKATRSADGKNISDITVTNYERLHYFNAADFGGIACDESSRLKHLEGATQKAVTEFMTSIPYRLLCTATAAPNDFLELGTSSEALGYLGARDMVTMFFKEKLDAGGPGWQRQKRWLLRGHAEQPFWRWVCSWARACRKPSDLGFSDDGFILPELIETEQVVKNSTPRDGMLFATPAIGLREEREERRVTIKERCSLVAELSSAHKGATVSWCHLNDEGDMLEKMIPGAKQVKGSMSDDEKEEILIAFQSGELDKIVIKPKIGCYGLNWQHCNQVTTFPSHSWEEYYQAVRRCWRFGQLNPVTVNIISTEGEVGIAANLKRKSDQAEAMFNHLVRHMSNELSIDKIAYGTKQEMEIPWLASIN